MWQPLGRARHVKIGKRPVAFRRPVDYPGATPHCHPSAGVTPVNRNNILSVIVLVLFVTIAGCVGAFFGIRYLWRQNDLKAFNTRLDEYIASAQQSKPTPGRVTVKPKILPVDVTGKKVDWLYYDLPDPIRPATPEEVQTVALLHYNEVVVGSYTNGGKAYRRTCQVRIVDLATKTVVAESTFQGGEPPKTIRNSSSGYGSYPTEQVVGYLKSLSTSQ
jgi:hypothetical protein